MDWREKALRQEAPYGLGLLPESDHLEYTDPRNEDVVTERWRGVLERLGIKVLYVRDTITGPTRFDFDGVEWLLEPMDNHRTYDVPVSVYHRVRAAEAEGVPFGYWIWGEEQFARPAFRPTPERAPASAARGAARESWFPRLVDPLVIAVIPTAPGRGLWCLLGAWLH